MDKSFLAPDTELVNSYSYSVIRVRNTTAVKPFRPMMTILVHEAARNSQILSKMTVKWNFKNGATKSAILGLIYNVLLPSSTLNISLIADVTKAILQAKTFGHTAEASSWRRESSYSFPMARWRSARSRHVGCTRCSRRSRSRSQKIVRFFATRKILGFYIGVCNCSRRNVLKEG